MPNLRCPSCYYSTSIKKEMINEGIRCVHCEFNLHAYYYAGRQKAEADDFIYSENERLKTIKLSNDRKVQQQSSQKMQSLREESRDKEFLEFRDRMYKLALQENWGSDGEKLAWNDPHAFHRLREDVEPKLYTEYKPTGLKGWFNSFRSFLVKAYFLLFRYRKVMQLAFMALLLAPLVFTYSVSGVGEILWSIGDYTVKLGAILDDHTFNLNVFDRFSSGRNPYNATSYAFSIFLLIYILPLLFEQLFLEFINDRGGFIFNFLSACLFVSVLCGFWFVAFYYGFLLHSTEYVSQNYIQDKITTLLGGVVASAWIIGPWPFLGAVIGWIVYDIIGSIRAKK
jgi:hypothetical protein